MSSSSRTADPMADQEYTFAQARARLEDIVAQVRQKDTSLEKSLDLLEEGVRLANVCTELSDHTEWQSVMEEELKASDEGEGTDETATEAGDGVHAGDGSETGDGSEDRSEDPGDGPVDASMPHA